MSNIRLINLKKDKGVTYDTYIGRANGYAGLPESKWHNPFVLERESDRDMILEKYREYILKRQDLIDALPELEGKTLACWCAPKKCHGHLLIELYEKFYEGREVKRGALF